MWDNDRLCGQPALGDARATTLDAVKRPRAPGTAIDTQNRTGFAPNDA
jgi:hypothetical protein